MPEFDARLAALRQRFVAQTTNDLDRLRAGIAAHDWDVLREICHSLAGRAGMFGFPELGDAARSLEEAIERGDAPEQLGRLSDRLLRQAAQFDQGR